MELPHDVPSLNTLSLSQREVDLNEDEKHILDFRVGEEIENIFKKIDHSTTISTRTPIELDATPLSPPNGLFSLVVRKPYRRAHIEATFDESGGASTLKAAKILLFEPETPYRGELFIASHYEEEGDEYKFDIGKTNHTFTPLESNEPGIPIPLLESNVKDFLDGLVTQGNEYAAITQPERDFAGSIRALLEVSSDLSIVKEANYQIHLGDESITIGARQQLHADNNNNQTVEGYQAIITEDTVITAPVDDTTCDVKTTCILKHTPEKVSAEIKANYTSVDTEYDIRGELFAKDLEEFNNTNEQSPGKFTTRILYGLGVLIENNDDPNTERLY